MNTVPNTSALSLKATPVNSIKDMVYTAIKSFGSTGCISDEVREYCNREFGLEPYFSTVTARYKKLYEDGDIDYTGKTRTGKSGRQQRVMIAR